MQKYFFKCLAVGFFILGAAGTSSGSSLIITGVIDGPLTGGTPKAVELFALDAISDLSDYGLGVANNGGGSDFIEFTFPTDTVAAGSFIYVSYESQGFDSFFDFTPNYTATAVNINGDDGVELYRHSMVVDVFGNIAEDGTGQPWEYLDGWAYRKSFMNDAPPAEFSIGEWIFSGPNLLDGEQKNITAGQPFPLGSFSPDNNFQPVPAPEPSSILLLGSGLALLAAKRRNVKLH